MEPLNSPAATEDPPRIAPRLALSQIALVVTVLVAGHFLYAVGGLGLYCETRWPVLGVYCSVIFLGILSMSTVGVTLALGRHGLSSVGLTREKFIANMAYGLAVLPLCYIANILIVAAYLAWTQLDVTAVAAEKLQTLQPLESVRENLIVPLAIFIGIYEEILFRGFLLTRLVAMFGRGAGATSAALLLASTVFGLVHFYQGPVGVAQTFAIGLILGVLFLWRRSVWGCIAAHAGVDILGLLALKYLGPLLHEAMSTSAPAP